MEEMFREGLSDSILGEDLSGAEDVSHEQGLLREDKTQLVVFVLHGQSFGVDIHNVMEVKEIPEITDVFHTPEFVVGVVNLRGDIIAILDIGSFFGMARTSVSDEQKMVILQYQNKDAGILAENMKGVQWVDDEDIQDPPPTVSGVSNEWIDGIIQEETDPLILLDIPSLFDSDRIIDL